MIIHSKSFKAISPTATVVSIRCPSCRHKGIFEKVVDQDLHTQRPVDDNSNSVEHVILGQRRCPSPECQAHIFFVASRGQLLASYPSETIDFDSSNLPQNVIKSFEEAIKWLDIAFRTDSNFTKK